ncbi:PspC domain-containing protein [Actinomycetospora cinnamomea]|uniref:Phage shock protein C (PspC) family protein n=1 Tax=Actinomycetospora cinnamomea TaxID=663609 RepID=A0A2U1F6X5_9PSEU|nr:PspC domain-containing protein [Actinomycetospora cinnamomea]PVZ07918.1 phage shock protein C (PspC) family protein [Actinomycetospora cinnamomea]
MSSPGQGSRAPAGSDVGATLRDMWATRPARLKEDRKIAGVAAAIARRYAIDPTLVRVAFVVSLFYGVGLLVYLAGILVLPRVDAAGRRETPVWAIVLGAILGIVAIGSAFSGDLGTVIGIVVALVLLYLLHHSRAHLRDPQRPAAVTDGTASGSAGAAGSEGGDTAQPPSWDPLGAAPFAWDLPEPAAPPAPKPPRSKVVPVTLGAAVLAAGLVAGLGLLGLVPLGATAIAGTALAVVGAGLVVGAFLHRGRGLLLAAVPLSLLLVAAANDDGGPWREGPPWADDRPGSAQTLGDASWAPTPNAVAPVYETAFGDATLDLRGLAAIPPGAPPVRTEVRSGAGDVTVLVPRTADVTASCESGGGDAECLGLGAGPVTDLGPDGPGGPVIDVQAVSGGGDVEVRRG